MRISARAFFRSSLLLSLTAGLLITDAVAGSISVNYGGTVAGVLPGDSFPGNVKISDVITNNSSFAYNPAQTPNTNLPSGKYTFTGTAQGFSLFVNTPGTSTTFWSDAYLGNPNTYMIIMTKSGSTTTMDIHVAMQGGPTLAGAKTKALLDLDLVSTTYTGGLALPNSTTINAFLLTPAKLIWDPPGAQGVGDQGFTGFIDVFNGQTVPEPSSLVLAIVGVATCTGGILISRRKAAEASRKG